MMRSWPVAVGLLAALVAMPTGATFAAPSIASPPSSPPMLLSWTPAEVRCDGVVIAGTPIRRPWNQLVSGNVRTPMPVTLDFAIDATGRPLSIVRQSAEFVSFQQDIGAALAASRFMAGAPRMKCSVAYVPHAEPLDSAPIDDLVSYSITPISGRLPKQGWDRIRTNGTCGDNPRPRPLVRAFPDYREVPATPGVRDWSLISYDMNGEGRPFNLRVAHGTGNRALDGAALKAVRGSRFTQGKRTHCLYPYWRAPARLEAPEKPETESFRAADAACAAKTEWTTRPKLVFPQPYRRRAIEGWAIVRYDLAPWGEVGNVKILASEPTEDFGAQAMQIIRSGRAAPSPQGATGCVDAVRFSMPSDDGASAKEQAAEPEY